jgi:2-polyprenyl-3-methyl-5-hydroxy-6-metoxy-1,4-benzoquinol methylase
MKTDTDTSINTDTDRLAEEAAFADREYAEQAHYDISPRQLAKYLSPRQMWDWRQRAARCLCDIRGLDVLDYGCGMGEESAYLARLGAQVTAIDISPKGIEVANERARRNGLADRISAMVMNCTPTEFPDASFDVVHGLGILHHVGLAAGLAEVYRVLRPGGRAVFLEPLGSSRAVEAAKRGLHRLFGHWLALIPVTSGEENLRLSDIEREGRARFGSVRVYPYRLTYRVRKLLIPKPLWDIALQFDDVLLRVLPPLRRFAGAAVIELGK